MVGGVRAEREGPLGLPQPHLLADADALPPARPGSSLGVVQHAQLDGAGRVVAPHRVRPQGQAGDQDADLLAGADVEAGEGVALDAESAHAGGDLLGRGDGGAEGDQVEDGVQQGGWHGWLLNWVVRGGS